MTFKNKILTQVKNYAVMAFGMLAFCAGWEFFVIPLHITGGGATGIAAIVYYATNGAVPISLAYLIFNAVLLIAAWFIIGRDFAIGTSIGVGMITLFFAIPMPEIFERLVGEPFPMFDPFMSVIIAGFIEGFGLAIAFSHGGSTGGTDIIGKIVTKYKDISLGRALIFVDILIICSSYFLPGNNVESVVYGIVFMLVSYSMMDVYLNGFRQSVQFFIYTKRPDEIAAAIAGEAHRGVTLLKGEGWYSKTDIRVVTVLARKHESSQIFHIIRNVDPDAFISQLPAMGVYGQGFESLKQTNG